MIEKIPPVNRFLKQLQQVPYLASKNLYRVMHHFLEMTPERREQFCKALSDAHAQVVKCERCWTWQERGEACSFCDNIQRDHAIICVVETWHDVYAIEQSGGYRGGYHVLGGALNPLAGVGANQLKIKELVTRITEKHHEIILALNQTPEGDATSVFISRALKAKNIQVTCLARGVPVGSSLEFTDRVTLHKALSDRRVF